MVLDLNSKQQQTLNITPRVYINSGVTKSEIQIDFKIDYFLKDYNSILPLTPYHVKNKYYLATLNIIRNALRVAPTKEKMSVIHLN